MQSRLTLPANCSRPIITTRETGDVAALADRLLKGRGFTKVRVVKDAMTAWKDARCPTVLQESQVITRREGEQP